MGGNWFDVDTNGLRQLCEGKSREFIIRELVQNSWDEPGVTSCRVSLGHNNGGRAARLVVEDDAPEGFYDLRHAYVLFAKTRKRADSTKRGRFNLGEKQVLSLCKRASIKTTTGTVVFDEDGRHNKREKTAAGSVFDAEIVMTKDDVAFAVARAMTFIPPVGIKTTINGQELPRRRLVAEIEATLDTEFEDDEGNWKNTKRKTTIKVYEPLFGEVATIYEMGLPVIATGDRYHYDVGQRVPLTTDRDNVRPAFLQDVRTAVLNALSETLTDKDASEKWVRDATADDKVSAEAVKRVADLRWGEKRCVADPNDPRSKEKAIAAGYHLVASAEMSKEEWDNVRKAEAVPSSSAIFGAQYAESENVPESEWTDAMKDTADLVRRTSKCALGFEVAVRVFRSKASEGANYGSRCVAFNLSRLGKRWFEGSLENRLCLIIHELGHEWGGHIEESYYNGLAKIGARLALRRDEWLK